MTKTIRVLLIEDSATYREVVRSMLAAAKTADFQLQSADCLAAGIERLGQNAIDAVLLDLTLPDSQGMDTFAQVQAAAPDVPIVIFTSLDDESLSLAMLEHGAADYLVKSEVNSSWLARALLYALQRGRTGHLGKPGEEAEAVSEKLLQIDRAADSDETRVAHILAKKLVDVMALEETKRRLYKLFEKGNCRNLLLDFARVEYLSNAAISTLLLVQKKARSLGGSLVLCNVSQQLYEQFSSRRFDKVFDIRESDAS